MKWIGRCLLLSVCGLTAGIVNGLLGAGSGVIVVFGLQAALGTSLPDSRDLFANATAVVLALSLVSAASYFLDGALPAEGLGQYLFPGALGGLFGAYLLGKLPEILVKRLFGLVVLISGLIMMIR